MAGKRREKQPSLHIKIKDICRQGETLFSWRRMGYGRLAHAVKGIIIRNSLKAENK